LETEVDAVAPRRVWAWMHPHRRPPPSSMCPPELSPPPPERAHSRGSAGVAGGGRGGAGVADGGRGGEAVAAASSEGAGDGGQREDTGSYVGSIGGGWWRPWRCWRRSWRRWRRRGEESMGGRKERVAAAGSGE
jgi:hypothetical protein